MVSGTNQAAGRFGQVISFSLAALAMIYLSYLLPRLLPGDFVTATYASANVTLTAEQEAGLRAYYTQDKGFGDYLLRLATLDWGYSYAFLTPVSDLFLGALQRICLARALVLGPRFLIADEPTSSLDPSVQAKVLKLLLDLQIERGLTMLFVSHDIGLVRKISDRIGVMLQGRMVERGPASSILTQPCHPYTRLLIESVRGAFSPELNRGNSRQHPAGCPFAPRCPERQEVCDEQAPQLRNIGHVQVACHFPSNPPLFPFLK